MFKYRRVLHAATVVIAAFFLLRNPNGGPQLVSVQKLSDYGDVCPPVESTVYASGYAALDTVSVDPQNNEIFLPVGTGAYGCLGANQGAPGNYKEGVLVWCPTSCLTPIWGRCIPLLAKEGWTRH